MLGSRTSAVARMEGARVFVCLVVCVLTLGCVGLLLSCFASLRFRSLQLHLGQEEGQ